MLHGETASVTKDSMFYIRKGRVMPPRGGNGRGLLRQKMGV
jgi:hypothetical protein